MRQLRSSSPTLSSMPLQPRKREPLVCGVVLRLEVLPRSSLAFLLRMRLAAVKGIFYSEGILSLCCLPAWARTLKLNHYAYASDCMTARNDPPQRVGMARTWTKKARATITPFGVNTRELKFDYLLGLVVVVKHSLLGLKSLLRKYSEPPVTRFLYFLF